MNLGQLITERRKKEGLTIDELAARSGIPKGTLNKIILGITKDPQLETVKAIARALNCTLDDFDDMPRNRRLTPQEHGHIRKYRQLDAHGQELVDLVLDKEFERCTEGISSSNCIDFAEKIPLKISEQPASAGTGVYLGPDGFSEWSVEDHALTRRAAFGVPVSGNSMEPMFHDGDIILVNFEPTEQGDIALVTMDGCGYVKKIGNGNLLSLNPVYEPIPMDESIRINGKVIGTLPKQWI